MLKVIFDYLLTKYVNFIKYNLEKIKKIYLHIKNIIKLYKKNCKYCKLY